jgi:hypothetical protein
MPGSIVEVSASPRPEAARIIEDLAGVTDVSVFGTSLHVHFEGSTDPEAAIGAALSSRGVRVEEIRVVPAVLEDAFLYLTRPSDHTVSAEAP